MLKTTTSVRKSDDLFEKSSMSFGEHLEELRKALAKVFFWVFLGTLVGMYVAKPVLDFIQMPLIQKIDAMMIEKTKKEWENRNGTTMPPNLEKMLREYKLVLEPVMFDIEGLKATVDYANRNSISSKQIQSDNSAPPATNESNPNTNDAESPELVSESPAATPTETNSTRETTQPKLATDLKKPLAEATDSSQFIPILLGQKIKAQTEAFGLQDGFMIWMKVGVVVGIIIASPGIFWHIWEFVAAGLYPHERKQVYFYVPFSVLLFLVGIFFSFFFIFPIIIKFLLEFNASIGAGTTPRLDYYITLALLLPLGFGVSFQLPLVMLIVDRIGIASPQFYLEHWKVAMLIEAFLSMILTPSGDVTSMMGMFLPLVLLYFFGIGLCKWIPKSGGMAYEGYDPK